MMIATHDNWECLCGIIHGGDEQECLSCSDVRPNPNFEEFEFNFTERFHSKEKWDRMKEIVNFESHKKLTPAEQISIQLELRGYVKGSLEFAKLLEDSLKIYHQP